MVAVRRVTAHSALFAALAGVTALIAALGIGLVGYLSIAALDGVRDGVSALTGSNGAYRVEATRSNNPTAQDARLRADLRLDIRDSDGPVPLTVTRMLGYSTPVSIQVGDTRESVRLASYSQLPRLAHLTSGAWPSGAGQVSLQADAAAALHLRTGDTVTLPRGQRVQVSGTWRAANARDPIWLGDPLISAGDDQGTAGPLVVSASTWSRIGLRPDARWVLQPDIARLQPSQLPALVRAGDRLQGQLSDDPRLTTTGVAVVGRLQASVEALRASVDAVSAVTPVALLIVLAIGLVTVAELGRLLDAVRSAETVLLRSRGASAVRLAGGTAIATVIVASAGATVGAGAAVAALVATTGRPPQPVISAAIAVTLVVVTTAIFGGIAFRSASAALRRDTANDSGRARTFTTSTGTVLVVAAAALALWQFRLYGSPLAPTADGGTAVDPVAVLAAPLALVAVALISLAVFPLVASAVARRGERRHGIRGALVGRYLARRARAAAASTALLALAGGVLVVAASYSATWGVSSAQTAAVRAGAGVVAQSGSGELRASEIADAPGVRAVGPALRIATTAGSATTVSLVAVPAATLASTGTTADGAVDPAGIARIISAPVAGRALPGGAAALALTAAWSPAAKVPELAAWVVGADGVPRSVAFSAVSEPAAAAGSASESRYVATLPAGDAATDIEAIDATVPGANGDFTAPLVPVSVTLSGLATADSLASAQAAAEGIQPVSLGRDWTPVDATPGTGAGEMEHLRGEGALGFRLSAGAVDVTTRLIPSWRDDAGIPAVVTTATARAVGASSVGSVSLAPNDTGGVVRARVVATTRVIPGMGADDAAIVDLGALEAQRLRAGNTVLEPDQLWIAGANLATLPQSLAAQLPTGTTFVGTSSGSSVVLGSARTALWLGAIGALVLALVAVGASASETLRARADEVVVLRAIGLGSRDQSAIRRREMVIPLVFAGITSAVSGAFATALTVPGLARAAVVAPYASLGTSLRLDALPLAAIGASCVVILGVIVAVYGSRVGAQAAALEKTRGVR